MSSAPHDNVSGAINHDDVDQRRNSTDDVSLVKTGKSRPITRRAQSLASNLYTPIKTPLLKPSVRMLVRDRKHRSSTVPFSKWREPSSILYPSKLMIAAVCRLLFPVWFVTSAARRALHEQSSADVESFVGEVLFHLDRIPLFSAVVQLFLYSVAIIPLVLHRTNESTPIGYFEEHIGSWGEIYSPVLMLVITSLTFATWDATNMPIHNPLLDICGGCCRDDDDADVVRSLGLGGRSAALNYLHEEDADERRKLLVDRMGMRARSRRRILRAYKFESIPIAVKRGGGLRTTEFCRQCTCGEYTADVIVDQIILSSSLARSGVVARTFTVCVCLTSSLVLACVPTIVRLAYGVLDRMDAKTIVIAVCYSISSFAFMWMHTSYFFRAIDVYSERRVYMSAVTSMGMLSDHEPHYRETDDDVATATLVSESEELNHLQRERRRFAGQHPMFPIELPQLDLSIPDHVIVFSKIRVFMQNILNERINKCSYHLSMLFVPLSTLGFAVLIEYLFVSRVAKQIITGTWIVIGILAVLGTLMFLTFLKAASVNALEMSHVKSLRRAQFRNGEQQWMLRRKGRLSPEREQQLGEADRMLENLCSLISSLGPLVRVLGMRVDYRFVFAIIGFLFWAFMTQFLRILMSK